MAGSDDLTSLDDCKAWLGLTSGADDALISGLIGAVSRAILADLGRPSILPTDVRDMLDGNAAGALALRHWPATKLYACAVAGVQLPLATLPGQRGVTLELADPMPPGAMQRLLVSGGGLPPGVQNVAVDYRAGYEILAETAVVPAVPPYVVIARAPYGPWHGDTGVGGNNAPYTATSGVYTFTAADAGAAITLSYGYVPADLARAACEWVADRYAARNRIGQSAKTLGGQETTSFIVKAMPDVVARLLQPYRRVAR